MIFETHDYRGQPVLINANEILTVEEAGASGCWHGIRSYICLSSGKTIDCGEDVKAVSKKIASLRECSE